MEKAKNGIATEIVLKGFSKYTEPTAVFVSCKENTKTPS
jgi:hypothetical protein